MGTVKRRVSFYIGIGQLRQELDDEPICARLDAYYDELSKKINADGLKDWMLSVLIVLRPCDAIGIAKRVTRYPSDKEAVVSLIVPIPTPEQAGYGSKYAGDPQYSRYAPLDPKGFRALDPDYGKFRDLADYVFESARRAMDEAFRLGFSVNGSKIRLRT